MSEVVVRLANQNDTDSIVKLLNSEVHKSDQHYHELYTDQSIQNLISNKSHYVFVAEEDNQLSAVVITCVVDAGTTLAVKNIRIGESFKGTDLGNVLLLGIYKYMGPNFSRLRRERLVSSCKDAMKLLGTSRNPYFKHPDSGKFTKVFELKQQAIKIEASWNLGTKLNDLIHDSCLVHLTKKEADAYIVRNLSCLCSHTFIVDSVPYMPLLSSCSAIFSESEYLLGEKQSDPNESHYRAPTPSGLGSGRTSPAFRAPTSTNGFGSGRNSPTRFQSSHMINMLDSLHTSLHSMGENLKDLADNLHNAKPKSFSHGKELSEPRGQKRWVATIHSENEKMFRAHALEQLQAAALRLKTGFTLTLNYNSAMANEARTLFTEELGLSWSDHERIAIEVFERPVDFSIQNGMTAL